MRGNTGFALQVEHGPEPWRRPAEVTVEQLAARALMSPRTLARRFQQETGTTPNRWVLRRRVLLEATDETVDAIAGRTGCGGAAPPLRPCRGHRSARLPADVPRPAGRLNARRRAGLTA
ncbi:hypothetical protein GCM10010294_20550 [Streptomyces griseoloalbus]|nr:hypothetical protein GCM10010294_20550 [Streptomyces griseoloalbus]